MYSKVHLQTIVCSSHTHNANNVRKTNKRLVSTTNECFVSLWNGCARRRVTDQLTDWLSTVGVVARTEAQQNVAHTQLYLFKMIGQPKKKKTRTKSTLPNRPTAYSSLLFKTNSTPPPSSSFLLTMSIHPNDDWLNDWLADQQAGDNRVCAHARFTGWFAKSTFFAYRPSSGAENRCSGRFLPTTSPARQLPAARKRLTNTKMSPFSNYLPLSSPPPPFYIPPPFIFPPFLIEDHRTQIVYIRTRFPINHDRTDRLLFSISSCVICVRPMSVS